MQNTATRCEVRREAPSRGRSDGALGAAAVATAFVYAEEVSSGANRGLDNSSPEPR